jgi:pimeloyl-ACP methyl ester carboxylesterase
LIHGTGACGSVWNPQVAGLHEDFTCATFDNRGIGQSEADVTSLSITEMADDAVTLLDHLRWDSAHIVGHSMGGLIAEQLALAVPERVRSLALLCTFASGKEAARFTFDTVRMELRHELAPARCGATHKSSGAPLYGQRQLDRVIGRMYQILLRSEVPLRRLDRRVSEEHLNLLQFAPGRAAELRSPPPESTSFFIDAHGVIETCRTSFLTQA